MTRVPLPARRVGSLQERPDLEDDGGLMACVRGRHGLATRTLAALLELCADADWTEDDELAEFGGRDATIELLFLELRTVVAEIRAARKPN